MALMRDAGITLSGYCRGGFFPATDAAGLRAAVDDNRRAVDEAKALGAPCLVLVVGSLPGALIGKPASRDISLARSQVIDGIAATLEYAKGSGMPLAIEPLHPMQAAERACINMLEQHQQGRIVVDGVELTDDVKKIDEVRRDVGMVFQHFNLFPHLTVMENLTLAPIWVRRMPKADAEEIAKASKLARCFRRTSLGKTPLWTRAKASKAPYTEKIAPDAPTPTASGCTTRESSEPAKPPRKYRTRNATLPNKRSTNCPTVTTTSRSTRAGPPCPRSRRQRSKSRGRSQAEDVAQQHPVAPEPVEGRRGVHAAVPAVPLAQAAPRGVLGLRHVQRPPNH